jgi:hypothetical protein
MNYKEILRDQLAKLFEVQSKLDLDKDNETANVIACSIAIAQVIQAFALCQIESQTPRASRRNPHLFLNHTEGSNTDEI